MNSSFTLEIGRDIRDKVKGLSLPEKAVLYDASYRANEYRQFFIRTEVWAAALEIDARSLQRIVASLIDKQLLHRDRRPGRSNLYKVLVSGNDKFVTTSAGETTNSSPPSDESVTHKTPLEDSSLEVQEEPLDGDTEDGGSGNGETSEEFGKDQDPKMKKRAYQLAENYYKACRTSYKARVALFTELKRLRWPHLPTCAPKFKYHIDQMAALNSAMTGSDDNVRQVCHALAHRIATWEPGDGKLKVYPTPTSVLAENFDSTVIGWHQAVKADQWEHHP